MDNSPFRKLSAELRNEIYELVVAQPTAVNLRYDYTMRQFMPSLTKTEDDENDEDDQPNMFAITRVCRDFRNECSGLVFASNTFRLIVQQHAYSSAFDALRELDKLKSLVRTDHGRILQATLVIDSFNSYVSKPSYRDEFAESLSRVNLRAQDDFCQTLHVCLRYMYTHFKCYFDVDIDMYDFDRSCGEALGLLQSKIQLLDDAVDKINILRIRSVVKAWKHQSA